MDPITLIALHTRMQAAAALTAGVVSNFPDDLVRDVEINEQTKAENLIAWRVFVIFDKALDAYAKANTTPLPPVTDLQGVVSQLLPIIGTIPGVGNIAKLIEAGLGVLNAAKPAPGISGPIPAPGP
jgi:hypothetical protein